MFDGTLRGTRFVVTLGGYVATEYSGRQSATRDIDSFLLAVTLLRGHPLDPIGANDLDVCEIPLGSTSVAVRQGRLSRLGAAFGLFPQFLIDFYKELQGFPVTDARILPEVVSFAGELAASPYRVAFSQALRAFAAKTDGEAITAFLSSWIVLEMFVSSELRLFLAAQGTPDLVISEGLKTWTIGSKVDLIRQLGVLKPIGVDDPTVPSAAQLREIVGLASVRNRVVHSGISPEPADVVKVVDLATKIMWRLVRLSGISYQPHLDAVNKIHAAFTTKHGL